MWYLKIEETLANVKRDEGRRENEGKDGREKWKKELLVKVWCYKYEVIFTDNDSVRRVLRFRSITYTKRNLKPAAFLCRTMHSKDSKSIRAMSSLIASLFERRTNKLRSIVEYKTKINLQSFQRIGNSYKEEKEKKNLFNGGFICPSIEIWAEHISQPCTQNNAR